MKLELNDAYFQLRFAQIQIVKTSRNLYCIIPCNTFFSKQMGPLFTYQNNQLLKFDKKYKFLLKEVNKIEDVKPITVESIIITRTLNFIPINLTYQLIMQRNQKLTLH